MCANDGCYVRTDGHLNEESAIKHWNTRKPLERIVEQLEEKSFVDYDEYYCDGGECLISMNEAIEIVKGGVDNG